SDYRLLTFLIAVKSSSARCIFVLLLVFRKDLIRIAIQPVLSRLGGCNHGMLARARVLGRMAARRIIATARGAALLTSSPMHPVTPDFPAFLAFRSLCALDRLNRPNMSTGWIGHQNTSPMRTAPDERRISRSTPRPPPMPRA